MSNRGPTTSGRATTSRAVSRREALVLGGLLGAAGGGLLIARALAPRWQVLAPSPVLRAALAQPGPEAGNPDGDLRMLVFTDFNCSACRTAHPAMMAAIRADAAVTLRFLDWPVFGEDSRAAARTALASHAQNLYLPVHAALMQGGRADAQAAEAALVAAGGNLAALRQTLVSEGPRIDGQLSRNAFHAFSLGLKGTPSHVIGRLLIEGAASERTFRRAFDAARKAGTDSPG
jgi:protein-disulfide isomerase